MKIIGVPLALGHLFEENGLGPFKDPPDGAVIRFAALRRLLPSIPDENIKIISTAGYTKGSPTKPTTINPISLADQLARYAQSHDPLLLPYLTHKPLGYGTEDEVKFAVAEAIGSGFASRDEKNVTIIFSSNKHHLLRVRKYAEAYVPKNWVIQYAIAKHEFTLKWHILEILKRIRDNSRIKKLIKQNI